MEERPPVRGLLIVIALVLIAALSAGFFGLRARREVLDRKQRMLTASMKTTLNELRGAIDAFKKQEGRPPQSLGELVPRYLRRIPNDPVTGAPNWRLSIEESVRVEDFTTAAPAKAGGIYDVHSSAPGRDADGQLWSQY